MTIKFGDRELTDGPPVGDGLFTIMRSDGEFINRWLRGAFAYTTFAAAKAEDSSVSVGRRSNYDDRPCVLIEPWPEPVAAVAERVKIGVVDGVQYIAIHDGVRGWNRTPRILDRGRVSASEVANLPGTYCDPWAMRQRIAELETQLTEARRHVATLMDVLDGAASPATAAEED